MPRRRRRTLAALVLVAPLMAVAIAGPASAAGELCGAITSTPRCNEGGIPLYVHPPGPAAPPPPSSPIPVDLSAFVADLTAFAATFTFSAADLFALLDVGFPL